MTFTEEVYASRLAAGFVYDQFFHRQRPLPTDFIPVVGQTTDLQGTTTYYIPQGNNTILIVRESVVELTGRITGLNLNPRIFEYVNVRKVRTGEFTFTYIDKNTPILNAIIDIASELQINKRFGTLVDLIGLALLRQELKFNRWIEESQEQRNLCFWHKGEVVKTPINMFSNVVVDLFFNDLATYKVGETKTPNQDSNSCNSDVLSNIILYDGKLPSLEIEDEEVVTLPLERTKRLIRETANLQIENLVYVGATSKYVVAMYEKNNVINVAYHKVNNGGEDAELL